MGLRNGVVCLAGFCALAGCAVSYEYGPPGRLRTLERTESPRPTARRGETGANESAGHGESWSPEASDPGHDSSGTQRGDRPAGGGLRLAQHEVPQVPDEDFADPPPPPADDAVEAPPPEQFDQPPGALQPAADRDREIRRSPAGPLDLQDVLQSVYDAYPLLAAAVQQRVIAAGDNLAAQGAFDLQLSGMAASMPLGFYEMHRFGVAAAQPLFHGGEAFAGYRIGRGFYPPWYGDRETKQGGEFRSGFTIPLAQNKRIDPRRALLFRTALGQQEAEPAIQEEFIQFVQFASYAYWDWVAAGLIYQVNVDLLNLAVGRVDEIRLGVEEGFYPEAEFVDNQRLIVTREAFVIDAERRLLQAAIQLSLFLRELDGTPFVPAAELLPEAFPPALPYDLEQLDADIERALANRPELRVLTFQRRQLEVDLAQARNLYLPVVDAGLVGSQDVGAEPKPIRDKGPFELEATVVASVPLQRREARGRILSIEGRLAQLTARLQFAGDTVVTDVQNAVAALDAAYRQIDRVTAALDLARAMEAFERERFEAGLSNILLLNLREQDTADAAATRVDAILRFYRAEADYRAALALDAVNPEAARPDVDATAAPLP